MILKYLYLGAIFFYTTAMITNAHRILLTFPHNSQLAKAMIFDIRDAFTHEGHTCAILDYSSRGKDLSLYKPIFFDAPFTQFKPTLFFTIDDYGITNTMLLAKDCLILSWIVQPPETCQSSISPLYARSKNYIPLLFSERYIPFMNQRGFRHPLVFENATPYTRLYNTPFTSCYACDIAFVGAYNEHRNTVLSCIDPRYTVHVYGPGEWHLPKHITVHNEECDYLTVVPRIYRSAKITLNITQWESPNQRLFDVPASQGFLLTDEKPFISRLFPSHCIATYTSVHDLNEKIAFFLSHDDIRHAYRTQSSLYVSQHHTYKDRISNMLATIAPLHPQKKQNQLWEAIVSHNAYQHALASHASNDSAAITALLRIAAQDTNHYEDALMLMATSCEHSTLANYATDLLAEEVEKTPTNDRLLYTLAFLVYLRHDTKAAEELCIQALHYNPYSLDAALLLADCYLEDHLINDAFKILSQTIALFPNSIPALKRMYALCVLIAQTDLAQKFEMRIAALETPSTLIK